MTQSMTVKYDVNFYYNHIFIYLSITITRDENHKHISNESSQKIYDENSNFSTIFITSTSIILESLATKKRSWHAQAAT